MARHKSTAGVISGYAARWNSASEDLGGWVEFIRKGAFRASLADGASVIAKVNHESNLSLGRTDSGTLRLEEDSLGLRFTCHVSDTTAGRDALVNIGRGDLAKCSFAFRVRDGGERWYQGPDGETRRELTSLDLSDISVVHSPAYPNTSVVQEGI